MPVFLVFLLSAFICALPEARAQQQSNCSDDTLAWVARADAAHPASVRAVQCFPAHVLLKLDMQGSGSLDVDVSHPAGQAFRRIGRLGVSPILEIDDFRKIPAPQQEAFETLCTWLAAHENEVLQSQAPRIPVLRRRLDPIQESVSIGNFWSSTAWAGLAFLLVWMAARAARKAMNTMAGRRDVIVLTILFVVALLLRLSLGPFGPHHVNGQGPQWILAASVDPARLFGYGPGYAEIFSFIKTIFTTYPDTAIFVGNAFFSALSAPLVFVLARKLGLDAHRALFAGALTTVDAVAIRFGATEAYFAPIMTLTLTAYVLFVSAAKRSRTNLRLESLVLATVGALVCAQAARIHPIAWGPVALGPLFVMATHVAPTNFRASWNEWVRRGARVAALAVLVVLVLVVTSGKVIASVAAGIHDHWDARAGGNTVGLWLLEHASIGLLLLAVAFVLAKPRGPLVPAVASILALIATRHAYGQSPIWIASYDRLWSAAIVIALASMIPTSFARVRHVWLLLGAAAIAAFAASFSTIAERTTEQLEHAFFRHAFASLPNGCRVVHVPRVDRRIVLLPEYAIHSPENAPLAVVAVSSADEVRRLKRSEPCLRYARTSICTSTDGRPACEAVEHGLHLVPIAERDLPAKPSHVMSTYDRDVVNVGLFEVRSPE
ncbi:MAG: hypothetical protein IPM54_45555 [Polyangiaceae bacterium]|nr:hypothetical protein [Polyangiaceae bacterium]